MLNKYQFKILKYINKNSKKGNSVCKKTIINKLVNKIRKNNYFVYRDDIINKYLNKYNLTKMDICDIIDKLIELNYIRYVGLDYHVVVKYEGKAYIAENNFKKAKLFIKNYIYPIFVAAVECYITYLFATNKL